MTAEFVQTRLKEAVEHLAASPASLQERVAYAYRGIMIRVVPSDLPDAMRSIFEQIEEQLNEVEPESADQTAAEASAAEMSNKEARAIAKAIVDLYERSRDLTDDDLDTDPGDNGEVPDPDEIEIDPHAGHDHD